MATRITTTRDKQVTENNVSTGVQVTTTEGKQTVRVALVLKEKQKFVIGGVQYQVLKALKQGVFIIKIRGMSSKIQEMEKG